VGAMLLWYNVREYGKYACVSARMNESPEWANRAANKWGWTDEKHDA